MFNYLIYNSMIKLKSRYTVIALYNNDKIPIYFGTLKECRLKMLELCGVYNVLLNQIFTPFPETPAKYFIAYNNKNYNSH